VLLLDEPTNHLDITTRERLEDALLAYAGTAVVVSHDRTFLERVADRVLLEAGSVRTFDGGLQQCLERLASERRLEREQRAGLEERAAPAAGRA
jgi:ATP-binding cassette subfamily F protein 3